MGRFATYYMYIVYNPPTKSLISAKTSMNVLVGTSVTL